MNLSLRFLCMFICEHRSSFLLSTYLGNFETLDNIGINYFPYLLNHLHSFPQNVCILMTSHLKLFTCMVMFPCGFHLHLLYD